MYRVHEMPTYDVPDMPGLLVRTPRKNPTIETLRRTEQIYDELNEHGISTVPYLAFELEGTPCIATHEIDGHNLQTLLERSDTSVLAGHIDALWANLASYMLIQRQDDKPYIANIYTPEQFELGRFRPDDPLDLWLTHLPVTADKFKVTDEYDEYESAAFHHIMTVMNLETTVGQRLEKSRAAIDRALDAFNDPLKASIGHAILNQDNRET